ncbi:nicotinamide riboside transporter PnuC [Simiduia litorea]|uniref:nicotinamide riboside transporter PnuC n=1 Tax=Simiduia litorea TaxID=1435348 RepID=UPI0036F3C12A
MLSEFNNVIQSAILEAHALSAFELVAVLLALAYIVLVLRESLWCWPAAFLSTAIYTWLFWEVALLMESVLNVYYMFMAGYGYWTWRYAKVNAEKSIESWSVKKHLLLITATTGLSLLAGYCMANFTQADFPWLDAATTCFAIVTTWLVAQKILENWLYWIVIDAASIYLYLNKGFMLTSVLFIVYIGIAIAGYFSWTKSYQYTVGAN